MNRKKIAGIRRKLEENLSNDRYQHTLDVAYTTAAPAMRYQTLIEDAELTGLLHDRAKKYDKKESLSIAEGSGVRFSAVDTATSQIRHAVIGPVVAEKRYGVAKPETLSVIRWHATERREMSLLEKIVFTADYIEPSRDRVDDLVEMRYLALQGLSFCACRITADTPHYLASEQIRTDQKTEKCYQWPKKVKGYDDK